MAIRATREVVLPTSVANAKLQVRWGNSHTVDQAQTTFYVDDRGIRALGKVKATDGSEVDLSSFDGMEKVGVRDPRWLPDERGVTQQVWSDRDVSNLRPGYSTDDAMTAYAYRGKTVDGWDIHQASNAIAGYPSAYNAAGEAPYVLMRLASTGEIVRGWLTGDGNVKDPAGP